MNFALLAGATAAERISSRLVAVSRKKVVFELAEVTGLAVFTSAILLNFNWLEPVEIASFMPMSFCSAHALLESGNHLAITFLIG